MPGWWEGRGASLRPEAPDRQQGAEVGGVLVEGGGQEAGGEVRGGGQVKGGDSVPGVTAGTTIFYI